MSGEWSGLLHLPIWATPRFGGKIWNLVPGSEAKWAGQIVVMNYPMFRRVGGGGYRQFCCFQILFTRRSVQTPANSRSFSEQTDPQREWGEYSYPGPQTTVKKQWLA